MSNDYFDEKIKEAAERIPTKEHMLATGLLQPFNNTNSGARKIMHGVHRSHIFPLMNGEVEIVGTGYEIRYGDRSSSIIKADTNYEVAAKISKFSFAPNHHYYLILKDEANKKLDMVERITYQYITEKYGYLYNNTYMDNLQPGSYIPKDTIIQKSLAFDEYNNRKDGCNFNVAYMTLDQNMEDSIIFSDVAAKKMTSPLIKPVSIMINENNIPLNIYGTENLYKCIPDIGEDIKDSTLIALRKEKKDEIVFTESVERLRTPMMGDDKKILTGKVIDIDVYCNNPANLDAYHNRQFKAYYEEKRRMCQEIVSTITGYMMNGYTLSFDLEKLYAISKRILNGDQFMDKKPFSNIILNVVVLEELPLKEGDKASNRFGGKGVVSKILPQSLMPMFGDNEHVDVIMNSGTMYNRENPGQVFELSITRVGTAIIRRIKNGDYTVDEAFKEIIDYINLVVPAQAKALQYQVDHMNYGEKKFLLESFIMDDCIRISTLPISDSFDIDRLAKLYERFPWVEQDHIKVPMRDSNGNIRYVPARRTIVIGKQYLFRLKQFAEEKFSATSLSATNIRGLNTKSKANKNYTEMHSNTPIRFGNMEINSMNHAGAESIIENLLIHSLSPHARRAVASMYTDNPYHINIQLDTEARNRSAEAVNTYLKTIGRRLVFRKILKRRVKLLTPTVYFDHDPHLIRKPVKFVDAHFNADEYFKEQDKYNKIKEKNKDKLVKPVGFYAIDMDKLKERQKNNERAYSDFHKNPRDIEED